MSTHSCTLNSPVVFICEAMEISTELCALMRPRHRDRLIGRPSVSALAGSSAAEVWISAAKDS